MKKWMALLLAALMLMCMLAACDSSDSDSDDDSDRKSSSRKNKDDDDDDEEEADTTITVDGTTTKKFGFDVPDETETTTTKATTAPTTAPTASKGDVTADIEKHIANHRAEYDNAISSTESMLGGAAKVSVFARGSSLVYSYQYTFDVGYLPDETLELMDQQLEASKAQMQSDLRGVRREVPEATSLVVEYLNVDGRLVFIKEIFPENSSKIV